MTYLYSGIEKSTRIIPDGSGSFCNFLIALSGAGYSKPYFMYVYRDTNGRCYTTTKTWTCPGYSFKTMDLGSSCGVILGNYLYYLGIKDADGSTQIVRLDKTTGNGNTEMTIGAGGKTIEK